MSSSTIDVHSHVLPAGFVEEARRGTAIDGVSVVKSGSTERINHRQGASFPLHRSFYDLETRLEDMDRAGTDRAVISISPTLYFYYVEGGEAVDFCARANDEIARMVQDSGGRLAGVATLPMQEPEAAVAELRRAVSGLGLVGAQIGTTVDGVTLDDERVQSVLACAQQLDVPLVLHEGHVGPREPFMDFHLENFIGNPLATTIAVSRLIFSGTLDELPGLRLVLMHGGGYLPYQIGRLDHGYRARPDGLRCSMPPSAYLQRFHFDTLTHLPVATRYLIDLVGADRVVYGTDFPYDMGGGPLSQQLLGVPLPASDREAIAHGNATAAFKLD